MKRNRWTRSIERSPTVKRAASSFAAYLAGTLLLMASVFLFLGGLLLVIGVTGSGWQDRARGIALIAGAIAAFAIGRWTTYEYSIQGPSSPD